jgi:uncharacterized protein
VGRLGFVQADPIRAPARAQDLTLFQRVKGYRAGDLERRYDELEIEEDFFVNYGFLARSFHALMHPRSGFERYSGARARQAERILGFVRERGAVHPRDVEAELGSGTEQNYWGGSSNVTTRLLDGLHYRGLLRVARREAGIRIYAPAPPPLARPRGDAPAAVDALIDLVVQKYGPLPAPTLANLVGRLRYATPQWRSALAAGLARAKERLPNALVSGLSWYWPDAALFPGSRAARARAEDDGRVRLLAPFDPVVWDRRRFELFWDWAYRFEAYTPIKRRKLGYYALPLLFRSRVIGWGNLAFAEGRVSASFGYVNGKAPRDPAFQRALAAELARFEGFLATRRSTR